MPNSEQSFPPSGGRRRAMGKKTFPLTNGSRQSPADQEDQGSGSKSASDHPHILHWPTAEQDCADLLEIANQGFEAWLKLRHPKKAQGYLKRLAKQVAGDRHALTKTESQIDIVESDLRECEAAIQTLEEDRPVTRYLDSPSWLHRIGQVSALAGIGLSAAAASGALAYTISVESGSDSPLIGMATLIPISLGALFLKHILNSDYLYQWSVPLTRTLMGLYIVALPLCFATIAGNYLFGIESAGTGLLSVGTEVDITTTFLGSRTALFSTTILVEVLSGYFGASLFERMTGRVRNPDDVKTDKEISIQKSYRRGLRKQLARLKNKATALCSRIQRRTAFLQHLSNLARRLFG